MFVFRFLLSELLFLASVLAFYSLSRYSPSDGFLLKKFINSNKMPYFRDFYFYDFRLKEMKFTKWKRFAVGTLKRKLQKIYHIFHICKDVMSFVFCCRKWNCSFLLLFLLLFFVEILAIKGISFIVRLMVSHWWFVFLKSYYYLNFSSWGLLLNRSWVACCKAAFTRCSCVIASWITLWITLFFWSISLSRFAPLRVFFWKNVVVIVVIN